MPKRFCKNCIPPYWTIFCPYKAMGEYEKERKWTFCKKRHLTLDEVKQQRALERKLSKMFDNRFK